MRTWCAGYATCRRSGYAEVVAVTMKNIAFEPSQVTAHVGDTVEWSHADIVVHTATARTGAWG